MEIYGTQLLLREALNTTCLYNYVNLFYQWREQQPDLPPYGVFFSEPFYQLMRLTLRAQEMKRLGGWRPRS